MNVVFGVVADKKSSGFYSQLSRTISARYNLSSSTLVSGPTSIGYVTNDGILIGTAENDEYLLVMSGILEKPLPKWRSGSPLNDPNSTAGYLLERYCENADKFLEKIYGQYSLAIANKKKGKLLLATDPNGHRRWYYWRTVDHLVFSTNLSSIAEAFKTHIEINRSYENFLLGFEFLPNGRTLYKDIFFLPSSSFLKSSSSGDFKVDLYSVAKSHQSLRKPDMFLDESEAMQLLYNQFVFALENQLPDIDRVAVLLGGFDSALVAAALKKLGKVVETFSFCFDEKRYNQRHTDTLSEYLGIKHHHVRITPETEKSYLHRYAHFFGQPYSQSQYFIHMAEACKVIREHGYLHCFTGDGCDDLFLGYPSVHARAQLFLKMPVISPNIVRMLMFFAKSPFLESHMGHVARLGRNVIQILGRDMPVRGHITNRVFDDISLSQLRRGKTPFQEINPEDVLYELCMGLEHLSPLRLAYHGKAVVGITRNRNEGCMDMTGISIQSPFNHRLIRNFVSQIPENYLRPEQSTKSKSTGKYILMEMASRFNLLPENIIYQKKACPVDSPVDYWYMGPLRKFILNLLEDLPFEYNHKYAADLLRPKLLEKLYREKISLGHFSGNAISFLVTYANFARFATASKNI